MSADSGTRDRNQRRRLEHREAYVEIEELEGDRRRVSVEPRNPSRPAVVRVCETAYPVELIAKLFEFRGVELCDEIQRGEGHYNELLLRYAILSYVPESVFEDKRLLDFGCGSGAWTVILARMFPNTTIVGVDLGADEVAIAELILRHYGMTNVSFVLSPDSNSLPSRLGDFDFIVMSAVWEHLLPLERRTLVPKLWSLLHKGGILFLNQTPHRWYPIEAHTTGLPLLNYMPSRLAHRAANRFSRRVPGDESWEELLRRGIRGGTEAEVLSVLRLGGDGQPVLLEPSRLGVNTRADLWYAYSNQMQPSKVKRIMRDAFKATSWVTRSGFGRALDLAIQKC